MSAILRGLTLWLVCVRCRDERSLATGASAQTLPEAKVKEAAERVTWAYDAETGDATCPVCLAKPLKLKRKRGK